MLFVTIATLSASMVSRSHATTHARRSEHTVRLARRTDLLPLAVLVHDTFAAYEPTYETSASFAAGPVRSAWLRAVTTARLALDIEQRMTPWDWCRHAMFVAESADGRLVGFCECWGEDAASLGNASATAPQPVLFNLCVAEDARRTGIARDLVHGCERQCVSWGDRQLFLKVREDNEPAVRLYEREGFERVELRGPASLPAWQERWKGGRQPLVLMRKPVRATADVSGPDQPRKAKQPADFLVTVEQVLAYDDRDALLWYGLLLLRNRKNLLPLYRVFPVALAILTWMAVIAYVSH